MPHYVAEKLAETGQAGFHRIATDHHGAREEGIIVSAATARYQLTRLLSVKRTV